jgi:hypothetical protein
MKVIFFILSLTLLISCTSSDSERFSLNNIQEMNPEISTLQNGKGFEQPVLHVKPGQTNQRLVIWEGENTGCWADANYLVCEIWHPNDFSAVLNVEFFRKENRAEGPVVQSGDFFGDVSGKPRLAAKIGVLPHLKTKVIFPLEHLDGQEIFMRRFPRQLKGTVLGNPMKPEDISKVAIRFAPFQEPHFLPEFEIAAVILCKELPKPFPTSENPVVDKFGQWTAKDWPGKTNSDEDLKNQLESQLENASSSSFPENWSQYGGWKEKQFEATGFFRTHYDGNRWWLARPELVGIHYFQWLDQPVFGRYDGENYNIGFMDICNRSYKELTEAAVKSHLKVYKVANGEVSPFDEVIEHIPSVHY